MIVAAQSTSCQADTISSADKAIARLYSAVIGGSAPIPPQQLVLVPVSLLRQYQEMITDLEESSRRDRQMLVELLRDREDFSEPEMTLGQLSASATAVVNSLIATVPNASFYRDEVEEL